MLTPIAVTIDEHLNINPVKISTFPKTFYEDDESSQAFCLTAFLIFLNNRSNLVRKIKGFLKNVYLCVVIGKWSQEQHIEKSMNPKYQRIIFHFSVVMALVILTLANISCGSTQRRIQMLTNIDSLTLSDPDSAKTLLVQMEDEIATFDEGVKAYYNLLRTKVDDKLRVVHTSDSVMLDVVDYYEKTNDPHLTEAYYYAGRCNFDIRKGEKALFYYQKALQDSVHINDFLRSRLFAQIGYVMLRSELLDEARKYQELALFYSEKIGDTLAMRYSKEDIATIDSLSKNIEIDEAMASARLMRIQNINERVRMSSLRQQNENLQSENKSGSSMWIVFVLVGVAAIGGAIWFIYNSKRKSSVSDNSETQIREVGPARRFFDAEINDLLEYRIQANKALKPVEWAQVEEKLLAFCPEFKERLYSLYNLSITEYRICLLLKQEMAPSKIAVLMAMGVSSVSQCRLRMQQKAFNGEGTAKDWDKFVLSL